jgi:hypothetical protein
LDNWILHNDNPQLADVLHKILPENAEKTPVYLDNGIDSQTAPEIRSFIAEFIVRVAKEYPNTNFVYFFNPESVLRRAVQAREGSLSFHVFWIKEAVSMCADLATCKFICSTMNLLRITLKIIKILRIIRLK